MASISSLQICQKAVPFPAPDNKLILAPSIDPGKLTYHTSVRNVIVACNFESNLTFDIVWEIISTRYTKTEQRMTPDCKTTPD